MHQEKASILNTSSRNYFNLPENLSGHENVSYEGTSQAAESYVEKMMNRVAQDNNIPNGQDQ